MRRKEIFKHTEQGWESKILCTSATGRVEVDEGGEKCSVPTWPRQSRSFFLVLAAAAAAAAAVVAAAAA